MTYVAEPSSPLSKGPRPATFRVKKQRSFRAASFEEGDRSSLTIAEAPEIPEGDEEWLDGYPFDDDEVDDLADLPRRTAEEAHSSLRHSGSVSMDRTPSGRFEIQEDDCLSPVARMHSMSDSIAAENLKNFQFYKDLEPRGQRALDSLVMHVSYPAGTVLFCQGDPPGNCYFILSGSVAIHVLGDDEREGPPVEAMQSIRRHSSVTGSVITAKGYRTVEGFSTYTSIAELGKQVGITSAGNIVGELALINSEERKASICCAEETEFLVISRKDFDRVMKSQMQRARDEKMAFLAEHVPGMREAPVVRGKPHAAYWFHKHAFDKGHAFLKQGEVAEECMFVLVQGELELLWHEPPPARRSFAPASPAHRSHAVSSTSLRRSAHLPSNRFGGDHGGVAGDHMQKVGVLMPGGVFGSFPVAGAPEPFTVTVSSKTCEVFQVTHQINKLPRKVLDSAKEYIARVTAWRLESLQRREATSRRLARPSSSLHVLNPTTPVPRPPPTTNGPSSPLGASAASTSGRRSLSYARASLRAQSRPSSAKLGASLGSTRSSMAFGSDATTATPLSKQASEPTLRRPQSAAGGIPDRRALLLEESRPHSAMPGRSRTPSKGFATP